MSGVRVGWYLDIVWVESLVHDMTWRIPKSLTLSIWAHSIFHFSSHFGRGLAEIVFTILLLADFLSFAFSLSSTYLIESCSISPSQSPFLSSSTPLSLYLPLFRFVSYYTLWWITSFFLIFYLFTDYRELWITVMN
jgi:hypothetical protein